MTDYKGFSGSYSIEDVQFLLRLRVLADTPVEQKEQLIQSGQLHYSEMLTLEKAPSPEHMQLFRQALQAGKQRLALEVQQLAQAIQEHRPQQPVVLVSFVRAGVPLGVLLVRALRAIGVDACHYGVSIIRDRGIDTSALAWIEARHAFEHLVFLDGWVGKGAIFTQLTASLAQRYPNRDIPFVSLSDPTGRSWLAASGDDWLIPFGILGSTISGLVSRSVWPSDGGWHQCMYYQHLVEHDVSNEFIASIEAEYDHLPLIPALKWTSEVRRKLAEQAEVALQQVITDYAIKNINLLKPGIAEATRAVMRRVPEAVLVQSLQDPNLRLLSHLAKQRGIALNVVGDRIAPYRAVTIIKRTI